MAKKFSLFLAAMALVAFAIPAFANADAVTSSKGVLAKASTNASEASTIVGVSTNTETTKTPLGTLKCKKVTVGGLLTKNSGTEVVASDDTTKGANSTEGCTVEGEPLTIDNPTLVELTAGSKASTTFVKLSFTATAGPVTCEYSNASATSIPFTYTVGGSSIHIAGKLKDPNRANCGEPEIHGDFALSIGGVAVILD